MTCSYLCRGCLSHFSVACKNAPIPLFLRFVYAFLRIIVWMALRVFYRRRLVLGREHFRFDGPAIVIANHPSTLMDVLNPALEICQEMFFLANYGLFRHPVSRWLLERLFCIPVMRPEDMRPGETRDNTRAFEAVFEHLARRGVLFIAPEGTSWMHRFVRPLKTGTARMALGAEAQNAWQLGVKVIPVGLSYSAPHRFRSDVVVQAGPPVWVAQWREEWEADPSAAVESMTQHLESCLRKLSLDARDEQGEQALEQWEALLHGEERLPQKAAFERLQQWLHRHLSDDRLVQQTLIYRRRLAEARLPDMALSSRCRKGVLRRRLALIAGLPLFALGGAFYFLPCFLPHWINRRLDLYVGYSATVMITAGIVVFPLYGWGIFCVLRGAELSALAALSFLGVLFGLGPFVEWYLTALGLERARVRARRYAQRAPTAYAQLLQLRASLCAQLGLHKGDG